MSRPSYKVRRPNLDTVIQQAKKAGQSVKSVTFQADGGFTLVFSGGNDVDSSTNEWDSVHEPV